MTDNLMRRDFLKRSTLAGAGVAATALSVPRLFAADEKKPLFQLSLAEWSLHRTIGSQKLDNLDFAKAAKNDYGIEAIEYVNRFFKEKANDEKYLAQLKQRAEDHGVTTLLIMIDGEGDLGNPNAEARTEAIENHYRWVEAAKYLGCHAIRVNAKSKGTFEEQQKLAVDGLRRLSEFGAKHEISVIVENHGGLSSNGAWLAGVIKKVGLKNCGTLPDFGNFRSYDRYKGVTELMPYAKAVSAKSHNFDAEGNETRTDYHRMMKIVLDAGYDGYVGIEYEGRKLSESKGILATKRLLERVRDKLASV